MNALKMAAQDAVPQDRVSHTLVPLEQPIPD